jgi:putative tryptophan/tyrosine transport system substrate-binding protein
MRRRDFVSIAGGIAAWPYAALAQPTSMPVIGLVGSVSKAVTDRRAASLAKGLSEMGYTVGRNVALEARAVDGQYERLPALIAEMIGMRVRLLATLAQPALDAAARATATVPIVFVAAFDPVRSGLLRSLGRPGGNITGVTFAAANLGAKRLELLREIAPRGALIAGLTNPASAEAATEIKDVEDAAASLQQPMAIFKAGTDSEIDSAFAEMARRRPGALLVGVDGFLFSRSERVIRLAAEHRIPAIHFAAEAAAAGGLMSYGASIAEAAVQAGVYAGRILKGAQPADLPVVQPDKVELVLNAKTAKALGMTFPQTLIARADHVIQ